MTRASAILVCLAPLLLAAPAIGGRFGEARELEGWQYRWGDGPGWAAEAGDAPGWAAVRPPQQPPGRAGREWLWLRARLPVDGAGPRSVYLETVTYAFEVYLDGRRVHASGELDAPTPGFRGWPPHFVDLGEDWAGRVLALRVRSTQPWIGVHSRVWFGSEGALVSRMLARDAQGLIAVSLMAAVGLAALVVYTRHRHRLYLYLAWFCVGAAAYYGCRLRFPRLSWDAPLLWTCGELWALYLFPAGVGAFVAEVLGPGPARVVRRMMQVLLAYAVVAALASALGLVPVWGTVRPAQVLILVGSALIIALAARAALSGHVEARIVSAGLLVLTATGMRDILVDMAVVEGDRFVSMWGMLAFVLALGGIALRRLVGVHHRLRRLKENLELILVGTREMASAHEQLAAVSRAVACLVGHVRLAPACDADVTLVGASGRAVRYPVLRAGAPVPATPEAVEDPGALDELRRERSAVGAGGELVVPLAGGAGFLRLGPYRGATLDPEDAHLSDTLAASLRMALQNLAYLADVEEKARLEAELETARAIQEALLPPPSAIPGVEIAATYRAATQTGGDWFSYRHDPARGRLDAYMGDVAGHGVPSALLTGVTAGAVRAHVLTSERLGDPARDSEARLRELFEVLNRIVLESGERMVTMIAASLDLETGEVVAISAGHRSLVVRAGGESHPIGLGPTTPLGLYEPAGFGVSRFVLAAGDALFLFTDGLVENRGPDERVLSERELRRLVRGQPSAAAMHAAVLDAARAVWRDTPPQDDVSVLVLRWLGGPSPPSS